MELCSSIFRVLPSSALQFGAVTPAGLESLLPRQDAATVCGSEDGASLTSVLLRVLAESLEVAEFTDLD